MNFTINSNLGLGDQLPYSSNTQFSSIAKYLPENATTADFFNIYSQEVKNYQLKGLFDEEGDGASIGNEGGGSILDSFVNNQFTNPLGLSKSGISLLPFSRDKAALEDLGQVDFLNSIKLMEEVQDNTALIGKNVSYVESNDGKIRKGKVEKVVIDNLVPYLVISDGRHLRINDVKEIENEE